MSETSNLISRQYRMPCGPTEVEANGICRRLLSEKFNNLIDRLTHEVHPEPIRSQNPPKGTTVGLSDKIVDATPTPPPSKPEETDEERGAKLLKQAKMKAEIRLATKQYEEKLQGNSKLLQDISGKYESI